MLSILIYSCHGAVDGRERSILLPALPVGRTCEQGWYWTQDPNWWPRPRIVAESPFVTLEGTRRAMSTVTLPQVVRLGGVFTVD